MYLLSAGERSARPEVCRCQQGPAVRVCRWVQAGGMVEYSF
jgi:hypothetical protein